MNGKEEQLSEISGTRGKLMIVISLKYFNYTPEKISDFQCCCSSKFLHVTVLLLITEELKFTLQYLVTDFISYSCEIVLRPKLLTDYYEF
jgi:hypothetical protein